MAGQKFTHKPPEGLVASGMYSNSNEAGQLADGTGLMLMIEQFDTPERAANEAGIAGKRTRVAKGCFVTTVVRAGTKGPQITAVINAFDPFK